MKLIALLLYIICLIITIMNFPIRTIADMIYFHELPKWFGKWDEYIDFNAGALISVHVPVDFVFLFGLTLDIIFILLIKWLLHHKHKSQECKL